jgi:hypothetical protein
MDVAQGELGSKVKYEADIQDGKLILKSEVDFVAFAEKAAAWIKGKIPGQYDDAIIDGFLALLKSAANKPE